MKRTVDEIKSIRILKARNGVALIAVLSILLILTLLLPVMFSMSEVSTMEAVKGTDKQRVMYLARSGVEIAVANLRNSFTREEYKEFYEAIDVAVNNNAANDTYGITIIPRDTSITDVNKDFAYGRAHFELSRIHLYQNSSSSKIEDSIYVSEADKGTYDGNSDYKYVGYVDVGINYDNRPVYYKKVGNGTPQRIGESEAVDSTTGLVKISNSSVTYLVSRDKVFYIEATAHLDGKPYVSRRSAALVKTLEASDEDTNILAFTGKTFGESPDFYLQMHDYHRNIIAGVTEIYDSSHVLVLPSKSTDNGGNLCLANPYNYNAKKEVAYDNPLYTEGNGYAKAYVYSYTTVGDMHLDANGEGSDSQNLAIGCYPGIRWKKANKPSCNEMICVNYHDYSEAVQYANFVSFAASNTMQVDLDIDVRVNPTRAGRFGDISVFGSSANASLFKMLNLEGKEIVLNGKADLMISFFNPKNHKHYNVGQTYNTGKRMGTVVLTAPKNTPYSYFNSERNKYVTAGKVYFVKDVYIWLIKYGNDGTGTGALDEGETIYKTGTVNPNAFTTTSFSNGSRTVKMEKQNIGDFEVYRLFKAGDVYYFNNELTDDNGDSLGVSLINYFIETQYLQKEKATDVRSWFTTLRANLYKSIIAGLSDDADTYVADDIHYIGNISADNIEVPDVENDVYVVWDN